MNSRFTPGQHGSFNEIQWRVVTGKKAPGDLRLDIATQEFRAVPMALGFLFADFFYQNEQNLYTPELGYLGGEKYRIGVNGAITLGYEAAVEWLEDERRRKRAA